MQKFIDLNKLYIKRFGLKPPVRVCVQATDKNDLAMSVFAVGTGTPVKNIHVQSFSTWAPANIGPYSQANLEEDRGVIFLAGQIGMDPAFMDFRKADS